MVIAHSGESDKWRSGGGAEGATTMALVDGDLSPNQVWGSVYTCLTEHGQNATELEFRSVVLTRYLVSPLSTLSHTENAVSPLGLAAKMDADGTKASENSSAQRDLPASAAEIVAVGGGSIFFLIFS